MPRKLRRAKRRIGAAAFVDPKRFIHSDAVGPDRYFRTPGYSTSEVAERAWQGCRRVVWAQTHRMDLPKGAVVYDGLSFRSRDRMLWSWQHVVFDGREVFEALDEDARALAAFETTNPKAAEAIADYLRLFRDDLAIVRACAEQCQALSHDLIRRSELGIYHRLVSGAIYGPGE